MRFSPLKDVINDAKANDAYKYIKPFLPIMDMLQERFNRFGPDDFNVVLKTAKWCLDNKMYQQGLTIWIDANAVCGDLALIQGDYGVTLMVVDHCLANGLRPIYATTERVVKEDKKFLPMGIDNAVYNLYNILCQR
ncbi:TM1812 family CRISPR-associated protein [Mahella sp.]|uniref:TM1812 family CRISPR-associated protein n=1 Tax=Mahella sp. TaxID=2798721 RepID=UPI0025C02EBF|nr:TM1812 family CRISPR-associated protein [Mahella sp.]MBZ4665843.1 CRISPR-associated protein family [Mahella sp.]